MDVLTQHKDRLVQLAERLVAEETIEQDEFEAMFADLPDPRGRHAHHPGPAATGLSSAERPRPPAACTAPSPRHSRRNRRPPHTDGAGREAGKDLSEMRNLRDCLSLRPKEPARTN